LNLQSQGHELNSELQAASQALGERLRRLRKANGLSLRQLAEGAGTSASFLSQLERGLTGASTSTLVRIANCFSTSISELFGGGEGPRHSVMRPHERPTLQLCNGQRKLLLGSRPVHAGSNTDLKVMIQPPRPEHDAIAILLVGGDPVANQLIEFRDHRD
jgi:transcriptional regulator with XRE-family HTH domain